MPRILSTRDSVFASTPYLVPVAYKGENLGDDLKMDFLVEDELVVEIKAVEKLMPIHEAQLLTYLKLTGYHTGLLLNFNFRLLKDGV